jgi:hypothetical protein
MDGTAISLIGIGAVTALNIIGWVITGFRQSNEAARQDGIWEERLRGMGEKVDGVTSTVGECCKDISDLSSRVSSLEVVVLNGKKRRKVRKR